MGLLREIDRIVDDWHRKAEEVLGFNEDDEGKIPSREEEPVVQVEKYCKWCRQTVEKCGCGGPQG